MWHLAGSSHVLSYLDHPLSYLHHHLVHVLTLSHLIQFRWTPYLDHLLTYSDRSLQYLYKDLPSRKQSHVEQGPPENSLAERVSSEEKPSPPM